MAISAIIRMDQQSPDPDGLARAAAALRDGGLVVAPTETRYGMLTRADDRAALQRLYEVKGRPASMPTSLFARGRDQIAQSGEITPIAQRLIERFLPGPLTVVLTARGGWEPPVVVDGKIGLRWSASALIDQLVGLVPFALTATSANRSGSGELATAGEIAQLFGPAVDLYLDAGPLTGLTSTVVDCSGREPRILREGAISAEAIRGSLEDVIEK